MDRYHGRFTNPTQELVARGEQSRPGMPLLRLQALSGNLHAPGMGWQGHPPAGVPALRQAYDDVGETARQLTRLGAVGFALQRGASHILRTRQMAAGRSEDVLGLESSHYTIAPGATT